MRETAREIAIKTPVETPIYQDQRQIVRNLGSHLPEAFMGQVTGAGGAGGDLENVPFEPALVEVINEGGGTPTWHKFAYPAGGSALGVSVAAAAADGTANAPTLTQVAEGDWTVGLNTTVAPDGETCTVIVYGFRDVAGSL